MTNCRSSAKDNGKGVVVRTTSSAGGQTRWNLSHHPCRYFELEYLTYAKFALPSLCQS